jgi:ABC-2 type transport system permease protein
VTTAPAALTRQRGRPRRTSVVATICRDDFQHLTRDRTALFFMLVLPVMVMIIVGATFGSIPERIPVGLLDADRTAASAEFRALLQRTPTLAVYPYTDEAELRRDVRTRSLDGGIVIPASFGATLDAGEPVALAMAVDLTQPNSQSLATIVSSAVAQEGEIIAAGQFAAAQTGADREASVQRARQLRERVPPVPVRIDPLTVDSPTDRSRSPNAGNPYAYTAISNLVLFVFVSTLAAGSATVERRQLGVTRRMLAAPVTAGAIVAGTGVSRLGMALAQSFVILAIGSLLFGVYWGEPVAVALLVTTFAALSTGVSLLVGATVANPNQVQAIGVPVAIGLGMLGGCMWPLDIVPEPMRVIGHVTPHAWAMDSWILLALANAGTPAILRNVAVLAAIAGVLAVAAALALRRSVLRS